MHGFHDIPGGAASDYGQVVLSIGCGTEGASARQNRKARCAALLQTSNSITQCESWDQASNWLLGTAHTNGIENMTRNIRRVSKILSKVITLAIRTHLQTTSDDKKWVA
jgi:hypothetical protein